MTEIMPVPRKIVNYCFTSRGLWLPVLLFVNRSGKNGAAGLLPGRAWQSHNMRVTAARGSLKIEICQIYIVYVIILFETNIFVNQLNASPRVV